MPERADLFHLIGVTDEALAAAAWLRVLRGPVRGPLADPATVRAQMAFARRVAQLANVRPGVHEGRVGVAAELHVSEAARASEAVPLTIPPLPDVRVFVQPTPSESPARLFVARAAGAAPEWVVESLPVELRLPAGLLEPPGEGRLPPEKRYPDGYDFRPGTPDSLQVVLRHLQESSIFVHLRVRMTSTGDFVVEPAVPISIGPSRFLGGLPALGIHDLGFVASRALAPGEDQREQALDWTRHPLGTPADSALVTARTVDVDVSRPPMSDLVGWLRRGRTARIEVVVEDVAIPIGGFDLPVPVPAHGRVGIRRDRTLTTSPSELSEYDLAAEPVKVRLGPVELWIQQLFLQTGSPPHDLPVNAEIAIVRSPHDRPTVTAMREADASRPAFTLTFSDEWYVALGVRALGGQPMGRQTATSPWRVEDRSGLHRESTVRTGTETVRVPGLTLLELPFAKLAVTIVGIRGGVAIGRLVGPDAARYSVMQALTGVADIGVFSTQRQVIHHRSPNSLPIEIETTSGRPIAKVFRDVGWDRGSFSVGALSLPEGVRVRAFGIMTVSITELAWVAEDNGGYYVSLSGGIDFGVPQAGPPAPSDERPARRRGHGAGIWVDRARFHVGGDPTAPPFLLDGVAVSVRAGGFSVDGYGGWRERRFDRGTQDERRLEELTLGLRVAFSAAGKDFLVGAQFLRGALRWTSRPERDFEYWLVGAQFSPIPIGAFQLVNLRGLFGMGVAPRLDAVSSDDRQMRLLDWYRDNEDALTIPDDRQLGPWRAERDALTLGLGAGLELPGGRAIRLDLFLLYSSSPSERGLLVLLRVYALNAEDPVGYGALDFDFNRSKWGLQLGVDLDLGRLLGVRGTLRLVRLTGTLYAGNQPATFAIGRLNDEATWLTLQATWRFAVGDVELRVAACLELVDGGPCGFGVAASLRGTIDLAILNLQAYAAGGLIVGTWRSESRAAGVRAWLEAGVRARVLWVFTFGVRARIEGEALCSSVVYSRAVAELQVETPWYLPDITLRYEGSTGAPDMERVEVIASPIVAAGARREQSGETRQLPVTPLRQDETETTVYDLEAVRAAGSAEFRPGAAAAPIAVDAAVALDFKPAVADRLSVGENTPPEAGREPASTGQNEMTLSYELVSLAVRRRPRFGPRSTGDFVDLQSPRETELVDPLDPTAISGSARFTPSVEIAWDRDLTSAGRLDPRRLLVNSRTPFSFVTGNDEADEAHARSEPGWPCATGTGAAAGWHELRFDDLVPGLRLPATQRFPDDPSVVQWADAPRPVVVTVGPGDRQAARLDPRPPAGLQVLATVVFASPAVALELGLDAEDQKGELVILGFRGLEPVAEEVVELFMEVPEILHVDLPGGATSVTIARRIDETSHQEGPGRVDIGFIRFRTLVDQLEDQVRARRGRERAARARSGRGKLAWLPNHEYELEATVRIAVAHNRTATTPQVALVAQRARFTTRGPLGLNAGRRVGEEIEPYVESCHPAPDAVVYRAEPVAIAFSEAFNVVTPVDRPATPGAPAERQQLLELALTVDQIGGTGPPVRVSRTADDWLTAHRAPGAPSLEALASALTGRVVVAGRREATSLDPLQLRWERLLANPEGCGAPARPLHGSRTLTHAPFDPSVSPPADLWAAGTRLRASVRPAGGPFVARDRFAPGDETAFTRSGATWSVHEGALRCAAAGGATGYASFGEHDWDHVELRATVTPSAGGAAGLAVGFADGPAGLAALLVDSPGAPPRLQIVTLTSTGPQEIVEPGGVPGGKALAARADAYTLTLTAYDDEIVAQAGDVSARAPRGAVRAGRAALVATGPGAFRALAVQPLEAYGFDFRTSRYRTFEDHIGSFSGTPGTLELGDPGPASPVQARLSDLATPAGLEAVAAAMRPGAAAEARQELWAKWAQQLALPLRAQLDGVEITRLTRGGAVEALLVESPEPIPCAGQVTATLQAPGVAAGRTAVLANGAQTVLLVFATDSSGALARLRGAVSLRLRLDRPRFRGAGVADTYSAEVTVEVQRPAPFVHRAAGGRHTSPLESAVTMGAEAATVLASPSWNPGGQGGVYNDHPIGVWWDGDDWHVFNQDIAPLAAGAAFVVSVGRGFVHRATAESVRANWTTVSHPELDGDPQAVLLATPVYNPEAASEGVYLRHAIGVWWTGTHWAVFNQDRAAMPVGVGFSLMTGTFVHRADARSITGNWTALDHPRLNGRPRALALVTPNYNPGGEGGVYHDHHIGLWYNGQRWAVFNQDYAAMAEGAAFNVWVAPDG